MPYVKRERALIHRIYRMLIGPEAKLRAIQAQVFNTDHYLPVNYQTGPRAGQELADRKRLPRVTLARSR